MTSHHNDGNDLNRERLREELRGAGLRATVARLAVFGVLYRHRRPMSHADVVNALGLKDWDRSTLYRNLMDLTDAGLVRRSELGDRVWRFEVVCGDGMGEHTAHFLCIDCGTIECLTDLTITPLDAHVVPQAIRAGSIEVQLKGQCDSCLSAS